MSGCTVQPAPSESPACTAVKLRFHDKRARGRVTRKAIHMAMLLYFLVFALAFAIALASLLWPTLRVFCQNVWDFPLLVVDIFFAMLQTASALILRRGRPRFPEWTIGLEFLQTFSHVVFGKYGENLVIEANAKAFRVSNGETGTREGVASCRDHHTTVEPVVVNGMEHLWIRGDGQRISEAGAQDKYVVLYFHGGGYTTCCPRLFISYGNRLRQAILNPLREAGLTQIDVEVFLANYRKAPEVQFPVPQEDALRMFEYLRDVEGIRPERLIIAGDSAGGALAISTMLRLRDLRGKATQPLAAILSCPWADFTDDKSPTRGLNCTMARGFLRASMKAFLPTCDDPSTWKDASAAYCELHDLAPSLVLVGTEDYLYQDSLKLFAKAEKDGAKDWELGVWKNMPHDFSIYTPDIVPDSVPALARMGAFVAKHIMANASSKK